MQRNKANNTGVPVPKRELEREMVGDEPYEYYPLGKYIVAAPGVYGGRLTFKYTRRRARGDSSCWTGAYQVGQETALRCGVTDDRER